MSHTETQPDFMKVLYERHAVKSYDTSVKIPKKEMEEMLHAAQAAPSGWNLQHWKFLVFDTEESKEKLLPIAYGQQQIVQASFVVAILADQEANKNAEVVFGEAVQKGYMSEEIKELLIGQIEGAFQNSGFGRKEALINASLAAMQLMLAVKAKGYDSCPIGGFKAEEFVEAFHVPERYLPIMLISIGKAAQPARPSTRLPLETSVVWNSF